MNKSWRQHTTKQQLYDRLPPITKPSKLNGYDMQDAAAERRMNR